MPKIGMRNIKTAVAVSLCLFLFIILYSINKTFATGWYTPFFAGIAAAYSVYPTKTKSVEQAKTRCIASIIGGVYAMILIFIFEFVSPNEWPNFGVSDTSDYIIPYILIALSVIFVIYIAVVTNQKNAVFVSILTFLSISIMGRTGVSFWQFGINRIMSTIIGVLIALGVNNFRLIHARNKNFIFIVGLDGLFPSDYGKIEGFINYKMNFLVQDGASVTLITTRTPTVVIPMLNNIIIKEPILVMSGAALFDINTKQYLYIEKMNIDLSRSLANFLREKHIIPFINIIDHNILYTYCESLNNTGEAKYAENRSNSPYGCFVYSKAPDKEYVYVMVIDKTRIIKSLLEDLKHSSFHGDIECQLYDSYEISGEIPGYSYLKIYSKRINKLKALDYFNNRELKVGLAVHEYDLALANHVDISITNAFSTKEIIEKSKIIEETKSIDKLFKRMDKVYTNKKYRKS